MLHSQPSTQSRATKPTDRITFPVSGMSCAACQAHVQKALRTRPGVSDATVNLMTREATVDFDPSVVTAFTWPKDYPQPAQVGFAALPIAEPAPKARRELVLPPPTKLELPAKGVVPPPKAEEMYSPEVFGRGPGDKVVIAE